MPKTVLIIQGHPDPAPERFCRALSKAYREGAESIGAEVRTIDVATIDFPILRTNADYQRGPDAAPDAIKRAAADIAWASHLLIIYPLWMGDMPALLKAFFEQTFRPGFALSYGEGFPKPMFKGKSARVAVTMGMPRSVYRLVFGAHGVKALEKSVLGFAGVKPIRESLFGMVEGQSPEKMAKRIDKFREAGAKDAA
ncbi:MAG: NAD(P)H-dependent oxidoreductase [Parvularculaceae bacterium]|nr:NAD(P)H-dependent oxidoreductase [Parvularculaceae bacterium]